MYIYSQSTGVLSLNGQKVAVGYSGHGAGLNCPELQNIQKVGPIPQGFYQMLPPIDTAKHGPYFIPLRPYPETQMFGRSDFGIHGERSEPPPGLASEGCIIVSPKPKRVQIWESGEHDLKVIH